jgi:hypothetical protein
VFLESLLLLVIDFHAGSGEGRGIKSSLMNLRTPTGRNGDGVKLMVFEAEGRTWTKVEKEKDVEEMPSFPTCLDGV